MPTINNTINLIRTNTNESRQFDAIEISVRKTAMIGLLIFISLSVVIGSVYALFYYKLDNQEAEKKALITRVNSLKNREAYLLAIKDRTRTVEKVMGNQKPWAQMLDLVSTIAVPPSLMSILVDEQDKIALTIKTQSLENVLHIVESIIANVDAAKIKSPQLNSFQMVKDGYFEVSISFYAVFNTL
jgi:hypothetical protein